MNAWGWINVIATGIAAAIEAGKAKRAQLVGDAPDLGWRERQAAADRERAAKGGAS